MTNSTLSIGSDWENVKSKIKETNVSITDEDLEYKEGQEDELLERLAKKMNRSREEVRAFIESVAVNKGVAG